MSVTVVELGPRDGLQNEPTSVPAADRVAFVRALAAAGLTRIEAGAFVHPGRVPQMASSDEVCAVLAADAPCSVCGRILRAGDDAHRALFDDPGKRVFLGPECRLLPEKE